MKRQNGPPSKEQADEVSALMVTLQETERRLDELTGGEGDALSDRPRSQYLLRHAPEQLPDGNAGQAAILSALPAHTALLDPRGIIVSVNETWRQFAGANMLQSLNSGIGLNYLEICDRATGSDSAQAREAASGIRSVLAGTASFSLEYPCNSPTAQRWFLLTVAPLTSAGARGAVVMHLDITDRHRVEEERTSEFSRANQVLQAENAERRLTENALRESNEKFHQLADNITDAFWIRSPDFSEVQYISPAFEQIWGRSAASLQANPLSWPDFIHPDDRELVQEVFAAFTKGAQSLDIEYRIERPSGEIRWVRSRGFQVRNERDELIRHIGIVTDITERRRTEQALREGEEHFRFLNDLVEGTRTLADPDQIMAVMSRMLGEHLRASRCAYADVERNGEQFTILHDYRDGCASIVGDYRLSSFGSRAVATLQSGQTLIVRDVDSELLAGEGADMFNAIGTKAIITCPLVKEGGLRAMMAVFQSTPRDWTAAEVTIVQETVERCWATIERRRAEEKLDQNEALLRIAGRTAQLGGWAVDLPGGQITWSDGVCAILDEPPGSVPGLEQALNYYTPQSREAVSQALAVCGQQGTAFDLELEVISAKGRPLWVRCTGEARRDAAGMITGVQGAFQDVTARNLGIQALRVSEQRFKALFEQAAVGVAQTDAMTGRFVQANLRLCEILGHSRQELEQLTIAAVTHPEDVSRSLEMVRQLNLGITREFTSEKRYLRRDGSVVWASVTVSAMWVAGETPDYFIAIVQDVTGQKKMEEQFRQAQKMDAIGTMAGGIAHDFNNILAAIIGYTELSTMFLQENSEVRDCLGAILQAAKRATELVAQILTFSRQRQTERRPLQLQPIVIEALKLLRASIPSTIEFETSFATDTPVVSADSTQIHQVLMNLGTNAWHAMKDRPGRLQVRLERCPVDIEHPVQRLSPGIYARVSISDSGSGMDQQTLHRIFEPFFTTKQPGEGTGLGLAVVHGIMASHDGAVTVYSEPGTGTVFHLYFPAFAGEAIVTGLENHKVSRGNQEKILFVDDEESLVRLGDRSLTALGYSVVALTEPVAALAMVRSEPQRFALVITDQTMPGMTGLILASELRKIRPELPIIMMTGYGLSLTPERLKEAGISQLLLKPISFQLLGAAVHAALYSHSLQ